LISAAVTGKIDVRQEDDLPLVSKVADLAHTWIYVETQNGISRSGSEDREDRAKQAGSRKQFAIHGRKVEIPCAAQPFSFTPPAYPP
jgi:hypothetical protein